MCGFVRLQMRVFLAQICQSFLVGVLRQQQLQDICCGLATVSYKKIPDTNSNNMRQAVQQQQRI